MIDARAAPSRWKRALRKMAESHDADAFSFPRMSCELSMLGGIDAFPGFGSAEVLREGSDVVAALPRMSAMMAASIPRESRMSLGYLQLVP